MAIDRRAYVEAWNRHDWDAVLGFFAADAVYEDRATHDRAEGRVAIQDWLAAVSRTFSSDCAFQLTDSFETEDGYAFEWVWRGTHDGSSARLPATGKRFEVRGVSVGRLASGKIVENHDYWDMTGFLMQVGLMPVPAAAAPAAR